MFICYEIRPLLSICTFSSDVEQCKMLPDQVYHYLWHLMLKISCEMCLIKFHFKRLKWRAFNVHYFLPQEKWLKTCLVSTGIGFFFFKPSQSLPNITKVVENLVTFGCCPERAKFGICGGDLRGWFQETERKLSRYPPSSNIWLVSFWSCPLPTPIFCTCYLDRTLLWLFNFLYF